ncbi:MAG TPA: ferritin-like domain-containing protein [Solirubrobacteraceae bacterium]|jgi:hypothetical protein
MSDQASAVDRAGLVTMLQQASELEHALTCQYLYAAFTLKAGGDPGLTPSQTMLCGHWNQQITKIAAQEMYHLMLASNLLTAIGERPRLSRSNFPQPAQHFSEIPLPSMLATFDAVTVHRFLCWEKPDVPGWWDQACLDCAAAVNERAGLPMLAAQDAPYSSIGQLYTEIDDALKANPDWIDPANAAKQVTSALVPFHPPVAPITTYADAHDHIEEIIREGEGTGDYDSQAHFAFFHQIYDELGNGPSFEPSWPTVENPAYDPALATPGATLITADDSRAAVALGGLFNDAYLLLLRTLDRLFQPDGDSDEQRQALANAAMAFMPLAIKALGILLTRVPLGGAHAGRFAGPSFELPQPLPSVATPAELYEDMEALTARARILTVQLDVDGTDHVASHLETILPLFAVPTEAVR